MKERPILFNTEMVKAVLEGRKTQARRVIKPQPEYRENTSVPEDSHYRHGTFFHHWNLDHPLVTVGDILKYCPQGKPGDRLWVRETTGRWGPHNNTQTHYRADGVELPTHGFCKWKPSIHMPKVDCRIFLEITNIRVERVQEISHSDCIKEGTARLTGHTKYRDFSGTHSQFLFMCLWNSINEKRGYGWGVNPWVWVVEFKMIKGKP